jgi:hypothetical protein
VDDDRKRSAIVGVGAVALAVTAIVAISNDGGADNRGVCVDRSTDTRVSDERCDDDASTGGGTSGGGGSSGGGGYGWYYIPSGRTAPGVGEKVSGQGSYTPPPSSVKRGGVAYDGGEVTRGGFFSGKSSFGG